MEIVQLGAAAAALLLPLWIGNLLGDFVRIVRLYPQVKRLPYWPAGVVDAFSAVTRGDLTPEQASLWLTWKELVRR